LAAEWPEVWNMNSTKDTRNTRQSTRQGICLFLRPEVVIVGALCDTGIIREHAANAARIARQLCLCWGDFEEESGAIVNGIIMVAFLCCGATSMQ